MIIIAQCVNKCFINTYSCCNSLIKSGSYKTFSNCQTSVSSCPVTAMEAVCKLPACSVKVTEANYELLSCPDPAEKAVFELSALSIIAKEATNELSVHPVSTYESEFEL